PRLTSSCGFPATCGQAYTGVITAVTRAETGEVLQRLDAMSDPPEGTTRTRPSRGEQLELDIENLAYGGKGIARQNGYVVFVAGALPGDRVRAQVTKAKRGYAEASAVEIVRPSPDRIPPRCDHGGEPCPGAPWQGLPYAEQLRHKQQQVEDSLTRL